MTDKILSRWLSAEIGRQLADNRESFEQTLREALPDKCEIDPILTDLLEAAARYSIQFSVQFMLRTLEKGNVIQLPEDEAPLLYPLDEV